MYPTNYQFQLIITNLHVYSGKLLMLLLCLLVAKLLLLHEINRLVKAFQMQCTPIERVFFLIGKTNLDNILAAELVSGFSVPSRKRKQGEAT